jgi:FkbM family methyltransferase
MQAQQREPISYSQYGEDLVLDQLVEGQVAGFYVDVGAAHPTRLSNTKLFYDRGWCGVNLEPHPEGWRKLAAARPRDVNLNIGVGAVEADITFYAFPRDPSLSSFNRADAERVCTQCGFRYVTSPVRVRPLSAILLDYAKDRTIDFMSVDTEGYETQVLIGNDWQRFRPRFLVVEAKVTGRVTTSAWEPRLLQVGYEYLGSIPPGHVNRFYRDRRILSLAVSSILVP